RPGRIRDHHDPDHRRGDRLDVRQAPIPCDRPQRDAGMSGQGLDESQWEQVDRYFTDLLAPADPAFAAALEANAAAGLPAHDVSPVQGKLLMLLAQMQQARAILEIGTLGGCSNLQLARPPAP